MVTEINFVDSSAFFRIGPTIQYMQQIDLLSIKTWLGYGVTNSTAFFSEMYGYQDAGGLRLPFCPTFFYSFGLLGSSYFLYFIFSSIKKLSYIFILLFILLLTNSNISTQIFWFVFINMIWIIKVR
jgi:hypothetical protein